MQTEQLKTVTTSAATNVRQWRLLECIECGDDGWTDNPRVRFCGVCAGDCGRDVSMLVKARSDENGWVSALDAFPPKGVEVETQEREVGTAKGGVPSHWRFKPSV